VLDDVAELLEDVVDFGWLTRCVEVGWVLELDEATLEGILFAIWEDVDDECWTDDSVDAAELAATGAAVACGVLAVDADEGVTWVLLEVESAWGDLAGLFKDEWIPARHVSWNEIYIYIYC
jgi:hypothetical protein